MRAALLGLILLGGCATVPQTPLVAGTKTEVVRIPVNVRCVSLSEVPKIPTTRLNSDKQTLEQMVIAIQIDFNNLEDYVVRADALLRACATEPQPSTDKRK